MTFPFTYYYMCYCSLDINLEVLGLQEDSLLSHCTGNYRTVIKSGFICDFDVHTYNELSITL